MYFFCTSQPQPQPFECTFPCTSLVYNRVLHHSVWDAWQPKPICLLCFYPYTNGNELACLKIKWLHLIIALFKNKIIAYINCSSYALWTLLIWIYTSPPTPNPFLGDASWRLYPVTIKNKEVYKVIVVIDCRYYCALIAMVSRQQTRQCRDVPTWWRRSVFYARRHFRRKGRATAD